ncbi:MAG: hypothetical protein ACNA8W_26550, partial [Bradymonadaceae bacterium]
MENLFEADIRQPLVESFAFGFYALSMMLVETLYVAGNFGLYISRRVELEGWDIELAFRKLAGRLENPLVDKLKHVVILLLLPMSLVAFSGTSSTVSAEELIAEEHDELFSDTPEDPYVIITEILESPEFGEEQTTTRWHLREKFEKDDKPARDFAWVTLLAHGLKILLWALVILGLAAVAYVLVRRALSHLGISKPPEADEWEQTLVHGEDAGTDGYVLPEDIVGHARRAWHGGEEERALSLLYLGTLEILEARYAILLDPGQTAYECVRTVRSAGGPHELVAALRDDGMDARHIPEVADIVRTLAAELEAGDVVLIMS